MSEIPLLYGSLIVSVISAEGLKDADGWGGGESDPYVTIHLGENQVARTKVISDSRNPTFDEGK